MSMDLHGLTRLGQATDYPDAYDAELLQPIPRSLGREALGLDEERLPFIGVDVWTHYELSWLMPGGKPRVAIGEIHVPADSENLIESKSLKLYFNSLNFTVFASDAAFVRQVEQDLSGAAGAEVSLRLQSAGEVPSATALPGTCLDDLPLVCEAYDPDPALLRPLDGEADEIWHSHLLRSNCPVTDQPDWASVVIRTVGTRVDPQSLLAYLVSYRRHSDFHEQCVERIFSDLQRQLGIAGLTVYARYTRRGGLDINPFRSNIDSLPQGWRTARQ